MNDRELLELAATAIGAEVYDHTILNDGVWLFQQGSPIDEDGARPVFLWNPLEDDGDAFRLFCDLKLRVEVFDAEVEVSDGLKAPIFIREGGARSGRSTAARRAIVRAAAEIGRAMP